MDTRARIRAASKTKLDLSKLAQAKINFIFSTDRDDTETRENAAAEFLKSYYTTYSSAYFTLGLRICSSVRHSTAGSLTMYEAGTGRG
jgi:ABC-type tungstate transport system permease subunit